MSFLLTAVAAVQRNAKALLMYTAGVLVIHGIGIAADFVLTGGAYVDPETLSAGTRAAGLLVALFQVPLAAAVTAAAFARIGKEMDRPLWRSAGDMDALRRFFQLWLVLLLANTAIIYMAGIAQSHESGLAALLLLLYLLLNAVTVPVGACVMFSGAVKWKELGTNVAPLLYQFPRTLLLGFLVFLQIMISDQVFAVRADAEAGYRWLLLAPVVTVIGAYIDCVVFAGAWLMCIEHRNSERDMDFDF